MCLNQDFIEKIRFFIFFEDGARACQNGPDFDCYSYPSTIWSDFFLPVAKRFCLAGQPFVYILYGGAVSFSRARVHIRDGGPPSVGWAESPPIRASANVADFALAVNDKNAVS